MSFQKSDLIKLQSVSELIGYNPEERRRVLGLCVSRSFANMQRWDPQSFLDDLRAALHLDLTKEKVEERPSVMDIVRLSPDLYETNSSGERFTFGDFVVFVKKSYSDETKKKFYSLVERFACMQPGYSRARKEFSIFTFQFDIKKSFIFEEIPDQKKFRAIPDFGEEEVNEAVAPHLEGKVFDSADYIALMQVVNALCDVSMFSMDRILQSIVNDLSYIETESAPETFSTFDYGQLYRSLTLNRETRGKNPGLDVLSKMFVARFPTSDLDPCVKIAHALYELSQAGKVPDPKVILLLANGHEASIRAVVEVAYPQAKVRCFSLSSRPVDGFSPTTVGEFVTLVLNDPSAAVVSDGLIFETAAVGKTKMSHAQFCDNDHQFALLSEYDLRRPFVLATLPFPYLPEDDVREVMEAEVFRVVQSPTRHSGVMVGFISAAIFNESISVLQAVDDIVYRSGVIDNIRQWVFDHGVVLPDSVLVLQKAAADAAPYMEMVRKVKIGLRAAVPPPPALVVDATASVPKKKKFGSLSRIAQRDSSGDEGESSKEVGKVGATKLQFKQVIEQTKQKSHEKKALEKYKKDRPRSEPAKDDRHASKKASDQRDRNYPSVNQSTGKTALVGANQPRTPAPSGNVPPFDKRLTAPAAYAGFLTAVYGIPYEEGVKKARYLKNDHSKMVSDLRSYVYRVETADYFALLEHGKSIYGDLGKAIYAVQVAFSSFECDGGKFRLNKAAKDFMLLNDTDTALEGSGMISADLNKLLDR